MQLIRLFFVGIQQVLRLLAYIVGNAGHASNQLMMPLSVVLDYANNLYITDYGNHRIQKYLSGSSTGTTVAGNGTPGSSEYQLQYPHRIITNSNTDLYISDGGNHRVQFWRLGDTSGITVAGTTDAWKRIFHSTTSIVLSMFEGSSRTASDRLNVPYGIALNPMSNMLYVSYARNHRIMSYGPSNNSGTSVFSGNGGSTNETQLDYPTRLYS